MTSSRTQQATLAVWLLGSLTLAACTPAPFGRAPARTASVAPPTSEVDAPVAPEVASLTLTPVLTVATGSREPHPMFSADSTRLTFHAVGAGRGQHASDKHSQVHVLDLRTHEDHIVYEGEHHDQPLQPNYYDAMAPNYDPTGTAGVAYDLSRRPVFLTEQLLLVSSPQLGAEFDPPRTRRLSLDGSHSQPFASRGTWPRVNADGSRVLMHSIDGITVVDAAGSTRDTMPGFFGVWAPEGRRALIHITPYLVEGNPGWTGGSWPGDIAVPAVNVGGLYLADEDGDSRRVLTEVGGRPDWLPDGASFVYERPVVDEASGEATMTIVEYDLETDTEREVVAGGRAPRVHPGGELMLYHEDATGELAVVDLVNPTPASSRTLGISGRDVVLSPDGRLLALTVPPGDRRGRGRDIVVYRLDAGEPSSSDDPVDTP